MIGLKFDYVDWLNKIEAVEKSNNCHKNWFRFSLLSIKVFDKLAYNFWNKFYNCSKEAEI